MAAVSADATGVDPKTLATGASLTALSVAQNFLAITKGTLELTKEYSKAVSTFTADIGKAVTAQ